MGNRLYFFEDTKTGKKRNTGIVASSGTAAKKKLQRPSPNNAKIYKVRELTSSEENAASQGRWVRGRADKSGPDSDNKRGYGPKRMKKSIILRGFEYELQGDRLIKKASVGSTKIKDGQSYQLNRNHRWEKVKHVAHEAAHQADHLGESVVSWKVGKVVGGAIAQMAIASGADPLHGQIISEAVVQAGTATTLHHIKQKRRGEASLPDTAAYFVAQIGAAMLGKYAHHGAEHMLEATGAEHMYQSMGALFAGKGAGIGTVAAANKSGLHHALVSHVVERSQHDLRFLEKVFTGGLRKAADGAMGNVPPANALMYDLTMAGICLAAHILKQEKSSLKPKLEKSASDKLKRVMRWKKIPIGLTHDPGDKRHGRSLAAGYGYIRGSYGDAEDGMAIDIYIGPDQGSDSVFRIKQVVPETGELDEWKYVLGCYSKNEAADLFKRCMPKRYFGGVEAVDLKSLLKYQN